MNDEKPKGKPSEMLSKLAISIGIFFLGGATVMLIFALFGLLLTLAGMLTMAMAEATGINVLDIRQGLLAFAMFGGAAVVAYWVNKD